MWDSSGSGCVRYSAGDAGERVMGHVVENDVLQAALLGQLRRPRAATELLWPARPHGHSPLHCASSCVVPGHSIATWLLLHSYACNIPMSCVWVDCALASATLQPCVSHACHACHACEYMPLD